MSETYVVTAKTVEEAVSIANREYGDENHEVSYEIVEMPKKGFLGIGSKDAKIKVTVTETKSIELGSLVADIRSMKTLTDRGNSEEKKPQKRDDKQNNQNKQKRDGNEQKQNNNKQNNQNNKQNNNKQNNQNNKQNNNKQNNQNKQKQENKQTNAPEKKAPAAPAAPAVEEKTQPKTRLNNQALPGKRSKQRKSAPTDADISASAVTVNTPANLSEFVSEKPAENSFGSSQRASGGRMNNDIRRGKKPAQGKPVSTETRDRQMLDSKYDVAETDDDYKNLEKLERDNENLLEREALSVLGLAENAPASVEPRTREAVTEAEMQYALEFANTLLGNMQIGATAVAMECPEDEELIVTETATVYPKINIVGDDSGILIGHHGETLDSIQYLVNLCALRKTKSKDGDYVKIVVDIENYRQKREDTLRALARRMAAKAVKYKRNVFLEPMNAYERRIIHSELQKYPGVSTHSVGSDRDRKIIITYEGADKAPENRSRRRRGNGDKKEKQQNQQPANSGESKPAGEKKQHRRPRKVQKLTIDKLGDLLDGNESVTIESPTEE